MLYLLHTLSNWVAGAAALGLVIGLFARDPQAKPGRILWVVLAVLLYAVGVAAVYYHWLNGRADFQLETGLLLVAAYALGFLAGAVLRAPFRRKAAVAPQEPRAAPIPDDLAADAEAFAGAAGALAAAAPAALGAASAAQDFLTSAPAPAREVEIEAQAAPQPENAAAIEEAPAQSERASSATRAETVAEEERPIRVEGVSEAEHAPAEKAAEATSEDDLRLIQGLDEETAGKLRERGVRRFSQVAAWASEGANPIAEELGLGPEARKYMIAQARLLAGGVAGAAAQGTRLDEAAAAALRAALPEAIEPRAHDALYAGRRPLSLLQPPHGVRDDLARIGGIDSHLAEKLNAIGIWTFAQIARWSDDNARWIGAYLAAPGRVERESWVAQARSLAAGQSAPA